MDEIDLCDNAWQRSTWFGAAFDLAVEFWGWMDGQRQIFVARKLLQGFCWCVSVAQKIVTKGQAFFF